MKRPFLTFAFCTYNRAKRLERLVASMRKQECPVPFEVLAVDNNSTDETSQVLERITKLPGPPMRIIHEARPGIVPARNRALNEAAESDILVFIDDDELPLPGLLSAVCEAILEEGAACVGGRIKVDFSEHRRPAWLGDELLGFLGAVDHGAVPFWITSQKTPVWSGNIAYDIGLFRREPSLRFDERFSRRGGAFGGGEDAAMLDAMIVKGVKIRYRPDMGVLHAVELDRLSKGYFLRRHYAAGLSAGQYLMPEFDRRLFGAPRYLWLQAFRHGLRSVPGFPYRSASAVRKAMIAAHSWGCVVGYRRRTSSE